MDNIALSPRELAEHLNLTAVSRTRKEEEKCILVPDISRPGLQLAGYFGVFPFERPQIIGKAEMAYMESLPLQICTERLKRYFSYNIPCVIITRGMKCPNIMLRQAMLSGVPIYVTQEVTSAFCASAITYLHEVFAPRVTQHGVLMDVFGQGVMIRGESGIGKSECALELINLGHQLVADDVVDIARVGNKLYGESPDMVRDLMELRGVGIVDVKKIFGIGAVERRKRIDLVIRIESWDQGKDYNRLGMTKETTDILGIKVPFMEIPARPGRSLATIVEIAARNWSLRKEGYDAAAELDRRLHLRYDSKEDDHHGKGTDD